MNSPPNNQEQELGLTSDRAFEKLFDEAKTTIAEWYSINVVNKLKPDAPNKIRTFSRFFCSRTFIYIRLCLVFLIVGSSDIDGYLTMSSIIIYILLLIYTILLEIWQNRVRANMFQLKYRNAFETIDKLQQTPRQHYIYHTSLEPVTDDVTIWQACFRDGRCVEVPRILLVQGDVIVFRPGQMAPCQCETFDGRVLMEGERIEWTVKRDENTNVVEPLEPIYARVTSYPIQSHLTTTLSAEESPLQFDYQLQFIIHKIFERFLIPLVATLAIIGTTIRFAYSHRDDDTLFATRFAIAIPSLIVLPLLTIQLPLILHHVKLWNNRLIAKRLDVTECFESSKDLVSVLSSITGASFVDKKGVLSAQHPSIEKLVFATNEDDCHFEVVNLSSEQDSQNPAMWNLSIDDPAWQRFAPHLLPIGHNILLNSCQHNEQFHKFLDHLSVIASTVPRTIATANRRCMCQLPLLMGFGERSVDNFTHQPPTIIGIYKRQPGEAPLPGLNKHRTPLEMAFCTVHKMSDHLHSHLSCQGTANIVVDACTHLWNGQRVVPLTKRMIASVKDFYQRNSMTGHCLAISYRPIFSKLDPSINGKFVEIPLNHENNRQIIGQALPRHRSDESINWSTLTTSDEIIDECFSGHILCGLVVLHYEAIPHAVSVIDKLDALCVRPVYFSKENELRSRVFAEKLGIEAGWNCHISLADEEIQSKRVEINMEQFVAKQTPSRPRFWKRFALSEAHLDTLDCESKLLRNSGSPTSRKMSLTAANNVGPIPNIARLPTGVGNVRPHLEAVDNVPLLVGLFTDSTTPAVEEMLEILQENGEVVLAIGSSRNVNNSQLFSKSNISICIDDVEESTCRLNPTQNEVSNVNEISSQLLALATDFRLSHRNLLRLPDLINCCRHRMLSFRHSFIFLLYSSTFLSLTLLASIYFFIPIIFTQCQVLLSTLIHIPILFIGSIFTDFEPRSNIIRIAPKNSEEMSKAEKIKLITTFLMQFLPTTVYLNVLFVLLDCDLVNFCIPGQQQGSEESIRHLLGFHFTACLCVLSSSFVYGLRTIVTSNPLKCWTWLAAVVVCLGSQLTYSLVRTAHISKLFPPIPSAVLLIWLIIIVLLNELIKLRRIRQFTREQRRTKFDFDTKLGMNSPY